MPDRTRSRPDVEIERLYEVNEAAARFYTGRLAGSGKAAGYLREHGIAHAAAPPSPWRLGYAPGRWTSLADHLRETGFSPEEVKAAGLGFSHRTNGHLLDRFRDRLVFPITNEHNQVIAFTGRDLSGRANAKWINSPETAIYHKSAVLYGLGQQLAHRPAGTGEPVVFVGEGAADVVALHWMGRAHAVFPDSVPTYAVAPCGTNLTREQLDLLGQQLAGAHLILVFDGDDAGARAIGRAYPIAIRWPGKVSVARLPRDQDPASILADADPLLAVMEILRVVDPLARVQMTSIITDLFAKGRITDPAKYPTDRLLAYRAIAELFIDAPDASREMAEAAAEHLGVPATDVIAGVVEAWEARNPDVNADPAPEPDHPPSPEPSTTPDPPSEVQDAPATPVSEYPPDDDQSAAVSAAARNAGPGVDTTAVQTRHDPRTGVTVWAFADGIGDRPEAATAAAMAAEIATAVALRSTPAAALHAARNAINGFYEGVHASQAGDASIVVVAAYPDNGGRHQLRYELAWAGDCRAYTVRGANLAQITADHTVGRDRRATKPGRPAGSVTDLLLTSSVRSGDISVCPLDGGPLLLCNNTVHRAVSDAQLGYELAGMSDAHTTANRLADAAGYKSTIRGTAAVLTIHARGAPPARATSVATGARTSAVVSGSPSALARTSFAEPVLPMPAQPPGNTSSANPGSITSLGRRR